MSVLALELTADGNITYLWCIGWTGSCRCIRRHRAMGIFALHLSAELVSIAGQYWLSDQIPTDFVDGNQSNF